jgi:hypothetical protein
MSEKKESIMEQEKGTRLQCCNDFWDRIPKDVPVFTIVAWDATAGQAISDWIDRAISRGVNKDKIARASAHIRAIEEWQEAHPELVKIPD